MLKAAANKQYLIAEKLKQTRDFIKNELSIDHEAVKELVKNMNTQRINTGS
jgi:hypothetical protein